MGKVLELSEETYQQLADLARRQQRTLEEMLRLCLATYEASLYERVHRQMVAEGLLAALPSRPLPIDVEDFEPVALPGPPSPRRSWRSGGNARVCGHQRLGQTLCH